MRVIQVSEQLLARRDTLSTPSWITLLTLNGASHFIRGEEIAAGESFRQILSVDSTFVLDSVLYSPKIVEFVNHLKGIISHPAEPRQSPEERRSIKEQKHQSELQMSSHDFNSALARSLVLPGWGHLALGSSAKGWCLTTAAAFTLVASAYYVIQTNEKEHEYLNEISRQNIASKYEDYNSACKTRNILLGIYAAIWSAAQLDLLFFSHDELTGMVSLTYRNDLLTSTPPYPSLSLAISL
jgi:hypothetical protein